MAGAQFARGVNLEIQVSALNLSDWNLAVRRRKTGPAARKPAYRMTAKTISASTPHVMLRRWFIAVDSLLCRGILQGHPVACAQTFFHQNAIATSSSDFDHPLLELEPAHT